MNQIHPTIKFTFESSSTDIPFLDTRVYIDKDRKLRTTLYKKPTDRQFLLHYQSNHPTHIKESIIYSQALRYNRIIHDDDLLQNELYNLTRTLLARKYPLHIINKNILSALSFSQTELLNKNLTTTDNDSHHNPLLPLTTKYHPKGVLLRDSIHKHWTTLQQDTVLKNIFPDKPITAYTKNNTIGNTLVRSDTT